MSRAAATENASYDVGPVASHAPTVAALTLAGAATAAVLWHGTASRSSQLFGRSIYRGDSKQRAIALTFDDGPSESTPALLDLLAEYRVPATFFQCGLNVQRHPEIARRVLREGHEIGNHTFSHIRICPRIGWKLNLRSPQNIFDEIARTQQIITAETGHIPRLFRAPYGFRWFGLAPALRRLNLLGVMWTVLGRDWELSARQIADLVLAKATPGGILCLHDGRDIRPNPDLSEMITALRVILPSLLEQGYRFETVSNLIRTP